MSHNKLKPQAYVTVDYVARPINDENWGAAMFEVASTRFRRVTEMKDPKLLKVNLLTGFEQDHIPKLSIKDSSRVSDGLYDLQTNQFPDGLTIPTEKVTVKKPNRILLNLVENDVLVEERRAVIDLLNLIMKTDFEYHPINFCVDLGRVKDSDSTPSIIREFTDSPMPTSVTLGQNVLGLTVDGVGQIER